MNPPGYRLVTEAHDLPQVAEALIAEPVIGLDTETTGLDPHTSRLRLIQLATPGTSFIIDLFRMPDGALRPILDCLAAPRPIKVLHNAKFDAKFLLRHYGIRLNAIFDTYLASVLISAG